MSLEEFYNDEVPSYVKGAGKSYIKIAVGSEWREGKTLKVKLSDVVEYYKTQAPNISSGLRTIAGWADDWRGIDAIAHECLEYFKFVNVDGLRKAAVSAGLTPKF